MRGFFSEVVILFRVPKRRTHRLAPAELAATHTVFAISFGISAGLSNYDTSHNSAFWELVGAGKTWFNAKNQFMNFERARF